MVFKRVIAQPGSGNPEVVDDDDGGDEVTVADLVALAAVNTSVLMDGSLATVRSVRDIYYLDKTGVHVADGVSVVTANPSGFWIARVWGRWDDLQGDISQGTANAALTYEAYRDTPFLMYFFRHNQNDSLSMRYQFPHGVDKTTAVVPHLHVIPMSAPGAAQNVRIVGQYAWAPLGVAVPANVGWTAFGPLLIPFGAADQFEEHIVDLAVCPVPAGFLGSDILFVFCQRTGTHIDDTYATAKVGGTGLANVALASFDVHYRKITHGSELIAPA